MIAKAMSVKGRVAVESLPLRAKIGAEAAEYGVNYAPW